MAPKYQNTLIAFNMPIGDHCEKCGQAITAGMSCKAVVSKADYRVIKTNHTIPSGTTETMQAYSIAVYVAATRVYCRKCAMQVTIYDIG